MSARRLVTLSMLVVQLSAACSDDGSGLRRLEPILELDQESLDFGEVPTRATKHLHLQLTNRGGASLIVSEITIDEPFGLRGAAEFELGPGQARDLDVTFSPTQTGTAAQVLVISSNAQDRPEVRISLSGTGIQGFLQAVPTALDFLATPVGAVAGAQIGLVSTHSEPITTKLVADFRRPSNFVFDGFPKVFEEPTPIVLSAFGGAVVFMSYQPIERGDDSGVVRFEVCGDECGVETVVSASAVVPSLRIAPAYLDFGDVGVRESRLLDVQIFNDGTQPFTISELRSESREVTASPSFSIPGDVQPGGSVIMSVRYSPESLQRLSSDLVIVSTAPEIPEAHIPMDGNPVGSLLLVQPDHLNFGPQRNEGPHRRILAVINGGSSDLRVDDIVRSGDPEFQVSGVVTPAFLRGGESLFVDVEYSPTAPGSHTATVTVTAGDERVSIPVSGSRADVFCELEVQPTVVQFGPVVLGASANLTVEVRNTGTDPCSIASGGFSPPYDPSMTVTSSAIPLDLLPSQSTRISFSFTPVREAEVKNLYRIQTTDPVVPFSVFSLAGLGLVERGCGDTLLDVGEECDDGNHVNGDGCEANCTTTGDCGNGILEIGEECDDGNLKPRDGCSMFCKQSSCGNFAIEPEEECDDGNLVNGDGCSSVCLRDILRGDFASAGLGGLRGLGTGHIDIHGITGPVQAALLYWNGPTNISDPDANARIKFDGTPIVGVNVGFSSSNCWAFANAQSYRADVTSRVSGSGSYQLDELVKNEVDINGASLLVVYDDGNPSNDKSIHLFDGNDSNIGSFYDSDGWYQLMGPITRSAGESVDLELHVSDGQNFEDSAMTLNGQSFLAYGGSFNGNTTPAAPSPVHAGGSLWDLRRFDVTRFVPVGSSSLELVANPMTNDCISLVAAVILTR